MKTNVEQIMEAHKVTEQVAEQILSEMAGSGLNFSECTQQEFNRSAASAYKTLNCRSFKKIKIQSFEIGEVDLKAYMEEYDIETEKQAIADIRQTAIDAIIAQLQLIGVKK